MIRDAVIEFRDVYRHFGRREVLRGLSLQVRPGEIFALLGRNGSGKTTALRTLMGFLTPHHGQTSLLGVESRSLGPKERGRVGYVSEGHRLYSDMRVAEAVDFEAATRPNFRREFATEAIRRCELREKTYIGFLSRGQRAQLSLILAAAGEPEVLIFDDPAMGLDAIMRREFLDAMIDLLSDRGCGVLFSSHILTDVERIADRVGILSEGRLIVDATLDDLKRRVQRGFWSGRGEGDAPPESAAILRARRRSGGYLLTLLDCDETIVAQLRSEGASLSDPESIPLEDLFMELLLERDRIGFLPSVEEVAR